VQLHRLTLPMLLLQARKALGSKPWWEDCQVAVCIVLDSAHLQFKESASVFWQ
jgi:hypothetical protein